MKKHFVTTMVVGAVLLVGSMAQAEKLEKSKFHDSTVEASYYDVDSIKVDGLLVRWTQKYVYTKRGADFNTKDSSRFETCKQAMAKKGNISYTLIDYEIKAGKYYRVVAARNYNDNNEVLCSDKDMGSKLQKTWQLIPRNSPMQGSYYDLVTKYKVNLVQKKK